MLCVCLIVHVIMCCGVSSISVIIRVLTTHATLLCHWSLYVNKGRQVGRVYRIEEIMIHKTLYPSFVFIKNVNFVCLK